MIDGIVTGTSDMLAGVDSSFFDGADADPQEAVEATPAGDETPIEEPAAVEEVDPVAEEAKPEEGTEEKPVEGDKPVDEVKADAVKVDAATLPQGVRMMKDRSGKEGYFVEPTAWEGIAASSKLVDDISNMIHAPATMEQIKVRNDAYEGQERMYTDFLSGDPVAQGRFIDDWILTAKSALDNGEIGGDPWVPFVGQLLSKLEQGSPTAYDTLRMADAERLVNELYDEAAKEQNQNLFHSASHVARALGLKWKPTAEMQQFFNQKKQGVDETTRLRQENQQLKEQVTGKQVQNEQSVYQTWTDELNKTLPTEVSTKAIQPALSNTLAEWKKLPGGEAAYKDLVIDRLESQVQTLIKADKPFMEQISRMQNQAVRARGAARDRIGEQIKQAMVNKAQLIVRAKRGEFETFAANAFKTKSDQTHARREVSQSQRAPKGASSPVQRSLVPGVGSGDKSGTIFNPRDAARDVATLIAAM